MKQEKIIIEKSHTENGDVNIEIYDIYSGHFIEKCDIFNEEKIKKVLYSTYLNSIHALFSEEELGDLDFDDQVKNIYPY